MLKRWESVEEHQNNYFWLHHVAYRIIVPQPGMNLGPYQWKHQVLTIEPQRDSPKWFFNGSFYLDNRRSLMMVVLT